MNAALNIVISITTIIVFILLVKSTSLWVIPFFLFGFLVGIGFFANMMYRRNTLFLKLINMDIEELNSWLK